MRAIEPASSLGEREHGRVSQPPALKIIAGDAVYCRAVSQPVMVTVGSRAVLAKTDQRTHWVWTAVPVKALTAQSPARGNRDARRLREAGAPPGLVAGKHMAPQSSPTLYRFYLLRADDHFARRLEDYFPDDATAMAAARSVIDDYPGVEIWCECRKVVTLSREAAARLQPPQKNPRTALLVSRNKRLLQQATQACSRSGALCTRPTARRDGAWAALTWQHQ